MASLTEQALHAADGITLRVMEEGIDELTGESKHWWALVVAALVFVAAVTGIVFAFRISRAAEPIDDSEAADVNAGGSGLSAPFAAGRT